MREYMDQFIYIVTILYQNNEIDRTTKGVLIKQAAAELDVYPEKTLRKLCEIEQWSLFKNAIRSFRELCKERRHEYE